MDHIGHISAQHLSLVVVIKLHIHPSFHQHIGREIIGIHKLLDLLAYIPSALVHILDMHL